MSIPLRILVALVACVPATSVAARAELHYLVLGGLGGAQEYDERFAAEAERLASAARLSAADDSHVRLLRGAGADREAIVQAFGELQSQLGAEDSLAVFLIGHGSFDGYDYKFNIPGPDLTAARLANLLETLPAKRQLIVNMTSSSGAMLETLAHSDRIVITATKNGRERNVTMFSKYWTAAFEDPESDLDKDDRITAQEAYDYAAAKVATFYEAAKRLATEHSRLEGEDSARNFTVAHLGEAAGLARDPAMAPLLRKREQLTMQVDGLKLRKDSMDEAAYFTELQELLIGLAELDAQIEAQTQSAVEDDGGVEGGPAGGDPGDGESGGAPQ